MATSAWGVAWLHKCRRNKKFVSKTLVLPSCRMVRHPSIKRLVTLWAKFEQHEIQMMLIKRTLDSQDVKDAKALAALQQDLQQHVYLAQRYARLIVQEEEKGMRKHKD